MAAGRSRWKKSAIGAKEKEFMNEELIEEIAKVVKQRCYHSDNVFGAGIWSHHITSVVTNGIKLAKQYQADVEIVTLAALLHDIASITKAEYISEHHLIGADIAEELLRDFHYPQEKIEHVKQCILNHRGSKMATKQTIEEICVADADAIAHFDNLPSLFSLVYKEKQLSIDEGASWIKAKLQRSYLKLSDESKEFYQGKYESVMSIFESLSEHKKPSKK